MKWFKDVLKALMSIKQSNHDMLKSHIVIIDKLDCIDKRLAKIKVVDTKELTKAIKDLSCDIKHIRKYARQAR